MRDKILELEKSLFKLEYMSNEDYLKQVLHKNFLECGKSGYLYNQRVTIDSLLQCTENRPITIYNFTYEELETNTYLIHYITTKDNKKYYRTSIWKKIGNLPQLYFHQATELHEDITLKES